MAKLVGVSCLTPPTCAKDRNFTRASLAKFIRAADAALDDYLPRLDQGDAAESGTAGARVGNLGKKIASLCGCPGFCRCPSGHGAANARCAAI
jgi:hypothetical protein